MHYKGVMIIATTEKGEKTWTGIKSFRILNRYFVFVISGYQIVVTQRILLARLFAIFLTG